MSKGSIQLEKFTLDEDRSFRVEDQFRLSEFYFWHFHPEIELVYISANRGIRHVGSHKSEYVDGDLVLIGSDIPHLNFDYQQVNEYDMIVVHMASDFYEKMYSSSVELRSIASLLHNSKFGICFSNEVKSVVSIMLYELAQMTGFKRYTHLLNILYVLSKDHEYEFLHEQPYPHKYIWKEQYRLNDLYRFIDHNYMNQIALSDAAGICHLSNEAFCRYFKKATNQTFVQFLNGYRIAQSKRMMLLTDSLSEIAFASGFESLAYFSRVFKQVSGLSPSEYRRKTLM